MLFRSPDEIIEVSRYVDLERANQELFMAAFMILKTMCQIRDLTHALILTNTTDNARLVIEYCNDIIAANLVHFDIPIYLNDLHSRKDVVFTSEIAKFEKSPLGIVSSVYMFGEGFDLPTLNCVVFAENMVAETRIIQSALRPNRLDKTNPNKRAFIAIPFIDTYWKLDDIAGMAKIRTVLSQLATEDETIYQKMKVLNIPKKPKDDTVAVCTRPILKDIKLEGNSDELEKIMIRLRHSKCLKRTDSLEAEEYQIGRAHV